MEAHEEHLTTLAACEQACRDSKELIRQSQIQIARLVEVSRGARARCMETRALLHDTAEQHADRLAWGNALCQALTQARTTAPVVICRDTRCPCGLSRQAPGP